MKNQIEKNGLTSVFAYQKWSTFLFILFFGSVLNLHAEERSAEDLFFEANVLAAGESYLEAIPFYEAAIAQRPSANLHYNLGNAYYHSGDPGRARIHWERALAMEPRHSSARLHLRALLQELNLHEAPAGFAARAAGLLSYNQWVWIGALSFWLIILSLLVRQWRKSGWLGVPVGFGALGILAAAASLFLLSPMRHQAIILDEGATLRIAPAPGSPVSGPLKPGQRVEVVGTHNAFVRVVLHDGQDGYVRTDELEKIW